MKHTLISTVAAAPPDEGFAGCSHAPAAPAQRRAGDPPVYVNGVHIAESAIAAEAQNHAARTGAEARAAAARALVIRHLLLKRARERELTPAPVMDAWGREETSEESLIRQVLALEAPGETPDDEACRRVYVAAPERFMAQEVVEASHILIAPDAPDAGAWDTARARAAALIEHLMSGADFQHMARQHSACPSAAEGGGLGQLTRGDLAPDIERVLDGLQPGAVAPAPVKTRHGWHVVRLDRRAPPRRLPFEAVAGAIRASLQQRSAIAAAARYVEVLASAASIEGLTLKEGERR